MKIEEITLFTNQIERQKQFYQNVMEFDLVFNSEEKITFKTGSSLLSFQYKKEVKQAHFAFNIPSNKIDEALIWLQKRVTILPDGEESISNFSSWNAKAVYFYDTDNNIVEFIARRDLNEESSTVFSSKSIISISEIGMVTTNISELYEAISSIKPIAVFDGNFNRFCALGNHEGLFILIDKTVKTWHPTGETAYTADFVIKGDYNFSFVDGAVQTA
ncbi:VOC family protein [Algibacter sp. L4_22]|uniref:VOC family protein n=1 Tax=Algibacter sp. L4_22 TaxID=2942477 RepID=UPI00201B8D9A|nr:VOC family protein [Algibacter sp. L4_22]MCL5128875.1 VOC family protein [Algibacter sp. L4_22]